MENTLDCKIEFAKFGGQLAENVGFSRSIGQIYGLLYGCPTPLSLDEISAALAMSKGNVSINIRILENWGAVRQVSINGSRRDHYEANTDIQTLVLKRLQEGLGRRLEQANESLEQLLNRAPENPAMRERLEELSSMVSKAKKAVGMLPKLLQLFKGLL